MTDAYSRAREKYAELEVDTEQALAALARIPISLQCWQGDDVGGFENVAIAQAVTTEARTSADRATPTDLELRIATSESGRVEMWRGFFRVRFGT